MHVCVPVRVRDHVRAASSWNLSVLPKAGVTGTHSYVQLVTRVLAIHTQVLMLSLSPLSDPWNKYSVHKNKHRDLRFPCVCGVGCGALVYLTVPDGNVKGLHVGVFFPF